jgi:NADH-quinone oxidoreductase subunit J
MIVQALAFYLFATLTVASGVMVISARNPVHSVLFLILAFFNSAGLFVLLGAEFLAMVLVIVYVGAVAVLFLFVVMMLDVDFRHLRHGVMQHLPVGALVGLVLALELILVVGGKWAGASRIAGASAPIPELDQVSNTHALGELIYTDYVYLFEASGLVLLVAMIGAIVLTLRHRDEVRRQSISDQVSRRVEDVLEIKDIQPGSGV